MHVVYSKFEDLSLVVRKYDTLDSSTQILHHLIIYLY